MGLGGGLGEGPGSGKVGLVVEGGDSPLRGPLVSTRGGCAIVGVGVAAAWVLGLFLARPACASCTKLTCLFGRTRADTIGWDQESTAP